MIRDDKIVEGKSTSIQQQQKNRGRNVYRRERNDKERTEPNNEAIITSKQQKKNTRAHTSVCIDVVYVLYVTAVYYKFKP